MFQKFKRKVLGVGQDQKTVDSTFDAAQANFMKLHELLPTIRKHISTFLSHSRGWVHSQALVSEDFSALFATAEPHQLGEVVSEHKRSAEDLSKAKYEEEAKKFDEGCLAKVNQIAEQFNALKARLEAREEMRSQLDYYRVKVGELQAKRDKAAASGVKEPPKDVERLDRNEKNLEEVQKSFTDKNNQLTQDLLRVWDNRLDLFGPVLVEFLRGQNNFASIFSSSAQHTNHLLQNYVHPPSWNELLGSVSGILNSGAPVSTESKQPSPPVTRPPPPFAPSVASSSSPAQPPPPAYPPPSAIPPPSHFPSSSQPSVAVDMGAAGTHNVTMQDAQHAAAFYQQNKTQVDAAARFGLAHKDQIASAAQTAQSFQKH